MTNSISLRQHLETILDENGDIQKLFKEILETDDVKIEDELVKYGLDNSSQQYKDASTAIESMKWIVNEFNQLARTALNLNQLVEKAVKYHVGDHEKHGQVYLEEFCGMWYVRSEDVMFDKEGNEHPMIAFEQFSEENGYHQLNDGIIAVNNLYTKNIL